MFMPGFGLVIALGLAVFFFKAAEFENLRFPLLWGGGSFLLYLGVGEVFDYGLLALIGAQLGLFVLLGAVKYVDQRRHGL